MATDYGVRQGLIGKGVSNDDIGYDQNTGYVQVKGQNFLKPEMNVQGTTYTSQPNFDSAYKQYQTGQRQQQQQQMTDQLVQKVNAPPAVNPYMDQYTKMISDIQARMAAPQQDVYSTPQYAAAQAQQGRAAQQGIRAAQESLGSSGLGRSTALAQNSQRVQNDANEYLTTQMVPQIQQQLAAQRQAEISNQASLLNPVLGLLNRQDTQDRNQQLDMKSVLDLLGTQGQNQINNDRNQVQDQRQIAQDERQAQQDHINLANELSRIYGITVDPKNDPALAYEQVRGLQPLAAQNQAFNQQMDVNKFEYGKARDGIQDSAQYAGMYNGQPTMQKIMQNATIANMTVDNLRQAAAEARAVGKEDIATKMDIWDRTGKAPDGIPGVPKGTVLGGKSNQVKVNDVIKELSDSTFVSQSNQTTIGEDGLPVVTKRPVVYDAVGLAKSILSRGLSDADIDYAMRYFNIDESEIKKALKSGN